jgi:nucleoid-associated protein YgaU
MGGQSSTKRAPQLVLCVLAVALALGGLHLAGRGPVAPPPLTSPSGWGRWLEQRDPVVAAFAVLRLAALAVGWYAAVVTVAGAAARLASRRRLVAALDHLTVPPLRRLLAATVSVSLSTGVATPALATSDRDAAPVVADTRASGTTAPTITMRRLPPASDPAPAPPTPAPAAHRTWTVQPGQCFWSIAEAVLAERLGRQATAEEVVPYWNRLIDANRAALADRDNPDLVFPGQVFTVPPP